MNTDNTSRQQIEKMQAENERLQRLLAEQKNKMIDQETVINTHQQLAAIYQNEIAERDNEIADLRERLNILLSKRYQAKSEQLKHLQGQLFDEAELEQAIEETRQSIEALEKDPETKATPSKPKKPKKKPKRKPLPDHLRRVDIEVDVSDEDKQFMGDDWVCIGYEVSEQLAVQQREYYVKVIKRKKYVRKSPPIATEQPEVHAEQKISGGIKVAPTAKAILPRAIADATLLADVLCSKFIDAMSFYRTHQRLSREGIDIGYSTLCDWPIQLHRQMEPLKRLFFEAIEQSHLWHLDETTLQVLDEPGRDNRSTSYLWTIRAGPPGATVVMFHYDERRNYQALETWLRPALSNFAGVIVTDEYSPYNTLVEQHPKIKAHGGCLAHCRRKFADAVKGRRHGSEAHKVLQKIALIYRQENNLKHLSGAQLIHARQERIKPLMDDLKGYLDAIADQFVSKGAMRTAIGYARNNWHKFTAFLDHSSLPIDNNPMEQAIRPFTLGRKNFLFAGGPNGAEASAFIYSLIESAKANGLEPFRYLNTLFERYPHAKSDDERRQLLPWNLNFSN